MAGERGWESGGAREGAQLTICDDNAASERAEARSDKRLTYQRNHPLPAETRSLSGRAGL